MLMVDEPTKEVPLVRDNLWRWRARAFSNLGFNIHQRRVLADREVSPHDAAALVLPPPDGKGCPLDLAFDILS